MTDWLNSTIAERTAQYKTFKRICRERRTNFDRLIDTVFEGKVKFGLAYESNCRKGLMSIERADVLAKWIEKNHPPHTAALESSLEDARRGLDHGRPIVSRHGDLKVISFRADGGASAADIDAALQSLHDARDRTRHEFALERAFAPPVLSKRK